jgi:hypothetical protein
MVHLNVIEARLQQLGIRSTRGFGPEIKELQHILMPEEKIVALVTGRYFGGFAIMVATDNRVLIIDKRILFLTVEDIRYDMISEIDFSARLMDATINMFTVNKQHRFTSMRHRHLMRNLTSYIQQRIMEIRNYGASPLPEPARSSAVQSRPVVPSYVTEPSPAVRKLAGSTAILGAHRPAINPYLKTAFTTRRRDWGSSY